VASWSDREVARRWLRICPVARTSDGQSEEPSDSDLGTITSNPEQLAEIRERLSHMSWFMRMIAEPIARRANREDQVSGRFWQGRFKAVKLCDEAAILACCVYVDLNPIRAGIARTPEASNFTSAQRRIQALFDREPMTEVDPHASPTDSRQPDDWLTPLSLDEAAAPGPMPSRSASRCSDKGFLPVSVAEYLELLDWTGRQIVNGHRGAIPNHLAPILDRLGIRPDGWLNLSSEFGRLFQRVAGSCRSIERQRNLRTGRRFRYGQARLLGSE
jgi:hypothetical protein